MRGVAAQNGADRPAGPSERTLLIVNRCDDATVLQRAFDDHKDPWKILFVKSAEEAIRSLDSNQVDLVVTDLRLPGMSGHDLLSLVKERYPEAIRVAASEPADPKDLLPQIGCAHRFVRKPCDPGILAEIIDRVTGLRRSLNNKQLHLAISKITALPSLPTLYCQLLDACRSDDPSISNLAAIIDKDMAMTTKLLQVVNSAYFCLGRRINTVIDAVSFLGVNHVRALVAGIEIFRKFESTGRVDLESVIDHGIRTSVWSQFLATDLGMSEVEQAEALLAGMLHDLGKLVLLQAMPNAYGRVLAAEAAQNGNDYDTERTYLGTDHGEVGAFLLSLWGFQESVVESVAYHHKPSLVNASSPNTITVVHVADVMTNLRTEKDWEHLDYGHLHAVGLVAQVEKWQKMLSEEQLAA